MSGVLEVVFSPVYYYRSIGIYFIVFSPSGCFSLSIEDSTAFLISCEFFGKINLQLELLFIIFVVKNYVSTWPRFVVELYFCLLSVLFGIKLLN